MDAVGRAERLISEALERGDLTPRKGLGEPLEHLDDDPGWWVRAWLAREAIPDRFAVVAAAHGRRIAEAIAADGLTEARAALTWANALAESWNREAPASHHLPHRSEVWLLDRRAERPAG